MSTQLTANEAAVLLTFNTYEDVESTKGDLGVSWTGIDEIAAATGKSLASVKGIIGSLIKKGLVESDEADAFSGKPVAQCLTEAGAEALFALRAGEEEETDDEEEEEMGSVTFIPGVDPQALAELLDGGPRVSPGLQAEMAAAAEVEGGDAPEAPTEAPAKPTKAKAPLRAKLVLLDLDGNAVTSRRAPEASTYALVLDLVTRFGGGVTTPVSDLEAAGFDADTLDRLRRRIRSWFGNGSVSQTKGGFTINLRVAREEEVEAA